MSRTLRVLAMPLVLGAMLFLAACGGGGYGTTPTGSTTPPSGGGAPNTITLQNFAFNPSTLTVKTGDIVTFTNADSAPHHIVVGTDDLGVQQPGESKTWTAPAAAVYNLKCLIHPSMSGQITVGAGGSTIGTPAAGGSTGGGTGGY
jgi:plastocyanin